MPKHLVLPGPAGTAIKKAGRLVLGQSVPAATKNKGRAYAATQHMTILFKDQKTDANIVKASCLSCAVGIQGLDGFYGKSPVEHCYLMDQHAAKVEYNIPLFVGVKGIRCVLSPSGWRLNGQAYEK